MIEQWGLDQYRTAAYNVCERMRESPVEQVLHSNGMSAPRWVLYAIRMHEHRLMQQAMQNYGPYGPV